MPAVSALPAITRGLASTARTITCAALIMVADFSGFMFAQDPLAKMMGLGLATAIAIAIAIDATIVRLVLVPATMTLLRKANWWLPGWLDRALPGGRTGTIGTDPAENDRARVGVVV